MKPPAFLLRGVKPHLLALLFFPFTFLAPASADTVWIDTDVAIGSPFREVDDAFALLLAFRSSKLKIAGISTTYGNAPVRATTASARVLLSKLRPPETIYPGAESRNDFGRETEATRALARALNQKGNLTYIALGPLTNLASFQRLHPALAHRIRRVIFLGGTSSEASLEFGWRHRIRIHDANVVKDPDAVAHVLGSRVPFKLIPVETAAQLTVTGSDLDAMRRDVAGDFVQGKSRFWLWFWTKFVGTEGAPIFDAAAILAAADPDRISFETRFATVDPVGQLILSKSGGPGRRAVWFGFRLTRGAGSFVRQKLRGPQPN